MLGAMPPSKATSSASAPSLDRGARALVILFLAALAVGAVVVAVHPGYRAAFLAALRGQPDDSPVARSNARYYDGL